MLMMLVLLMITVTLLLTYYEECCTVQRIYLKDKEDNPWMTTSLKNTCMKENKKCLRNKIQDNEKGTTCINISLLYFCSVRDTVNNNYANLLNKYKNTIMQT